MSGGKWSTTDRVLKSCRRKMGIIYTCNHKNNDHPGYDHNLLVVTCGNLYIYIYIYIYIYNTYIYIIHIYIYIIYIYYV